ncbi:MAG: hypothetical protein AAFO74_03460 [Pseudomonadota bacterium]
MSKSTASSKPKSGEKGIKTEELIRRYFLHAGFFVCRGLKLAFDGDDITDVDIWIYERSATLARRRTIIDVKDKQRPQAAERLLFVMGLAKLLQAEGCGVVTTDNRQSVRELARKQKVLWINGDDLKRLKSSKPLFETRRITEEALTSQFSDIDRARGPKILQGLYETSKSSLADRFGIQSANHCLDCALRSAELSIRAHPNSEQAISITRLTYLLAAMAAASYDFASAEAALRPHEERTRLLANSIRFGADAKGFADRIEWLEKAVSTFSEGGSVTAKQIVTGLRKGIPGTAADSLSEVIVRLSHDHRLFEAARQLEAAAFSEKLPSFKSLDNGAAAVLGAILDFGDIERRVFAEAWNDSNPIATLT